MKKNYMFRAKRFFCLSLFFNIFLLSDISIAKDIPISAPAEGVSFTVIVLDSAQKTPMQLVRIVLRRNGKLISSKATDPLGRAQFSEVNPGMYFISVRFVGYLDFADSVYIDNTHTIDTIFLKEILHEEL